MPNFIRKGKSTFLKLMKHSKFSSLFLGLMLGFSFAFTIFWNCSQQKLVTINEQTIYSVAAENDIVDDFDHIMLPPIQEDIQYDSIRVCVWIMTCPKYLYSKAAAVKRTWARRANHVVYMSTKADPDFPAVDINVTEGYSHLTAKTMKSFLYMYDHHFNDCDWFMKADDDTYVIMENLRYFLSDKNPGKPVYFGHWFMLHSEGFEGYHSGGAGYVLSKEALRRFATSTEKRLACRTDGGSEDMEFGKCLYSLGVHPVSSLDSNGRSRFHGYWPEMFIFGVFPHWYAQGHKYGSRKGVGNMSENAISFHYVKPETMFTWEYVLYHLKVFKPPQHGDNLLAKNIREV